MDIHEIVESEKHFFRTGVTRGVDFRIDMLKKFRKAIIENDELISAALKADLNKQPFESYMCETGLLLEEINLHIKRLQEMEQNAPREVRHWSAPRQELRLPGALRRRAHHGAVELSRPALPGCRSSAAISAGNCAVVKPSAYAPASSRVDRKADRRPHSRPELRRRRRGRARGEQGAARRTRLTTYSSPAASTVGQDRHGGAAAKQLTPVTLELGGKSPVIVDETADIAARRAAHRLRQGAQRRSDLRRAGLSARLTSALKRRLSSEYRKALADFFPDGGHVRHEVRPS